MNPIIPATPEGDKTPMTDAVEANIAAIIHQFDHGHITQPDLPGYLHGALENSRSLERRISALETALMPFANFTFSKNSAWNEADESSVVLCGYSDDEIGRETGVNVTLGDFKKARALLTSTPTPQ